MPKRQRQELDAPANKSVEYLRKVHELYNTKLDEMISNFQRTYEIGRDERIFAKSREEIMYKTFVGIFDMCGELHGHRCWAIKSVVHSTEWKRALFSQEKFAELGAELGDPVQYLESIKSALAYDIPDLENGIEDELKIKTECVRKYVGGGIIPDGGIDAGARHAAEFGLLEHLEDIVIEQKELADKAEKILAVKGYLPRLEYLKPVVEEIRRIRAEKK
jgi:hypothetical protein